MHLGEIVDELGGFATKRGLVRRGACDRDLTRAVRAGHVRRARNGWYSTAVETDPAFRAVRLGGRLTSASALAAEGAWLGEHDRRLHVSVAPNASRLRSPNHRRRPLGRRRQRGAVVVHWDSAAVRGRGSATAVATVDAIAAFLRDAPFQSAVAVLDWALRNGKLAANDISTITTGMPVRLRSIWEWVDPDCDSYAESIARTGLRMAGYRVRSQVPIGAFELIDLVVEDHIALEVDGEEHHATRFHKDRRKDLRITVGGRHAVRITFPVLVNEWPEVLVGIEAALRARHVVIDRRLSNRTPPANADTSTADIGRFRRLRLPVFTTVEGAGWP